MKQTENLIDYFLDKNTGHKAIIIGHSMASDIIFRVANLKDDIIGSIGISNYTDQIKRNHPKNVLIINGFWEKGLRKKALDILETIGIKTLMRIFCMDLLVMVLLVKYNLSNIQIILAFYIPTIPN